MVRSGGVRGGVAAVTDPLNRPFTVDDVRFVSRLSGVLATGTQLGLLRSEAGPSSDPSAPAVVVVSGELAITSMTANAASWLAELPDTGPFRSDRLPMPVQVVALRAVSAATGDATVTVRAARRGWVRVRGARLASSGPPQVAVVIDAAPAEHATPVWLAAYGLTPRETEVVHLVLGGRSTRQIAAELVLSPYTVQDRLKAVFEKVGVRSRRELVAAVHASDYQPLIDDNDTRHRTTSVRPW